MIDKYIVLHDCQKKTFLKQTLGLLNDPLMMSQRATVQGLLSNFRILTSQSFSKVFFPRVLSSLFLEK